MKINILVLSFLITHMFFFVLFTLIFSLVYSTFSHLITNGSWFLTYSIFIGSWISSLATMEVNKKLKDDCFK